MTTAIRVRAGEIRYENEARLSPEERATWIQAHGGKGGVNYGRAYAEVTGNPVLLEGKDRRHWVYMGQDKLLMMASGQWTASEVKDLMHRYALKEGGVKNQKLWFEVQDPTPFLRKDSEGALRLTSNPVYQWLSDRRQWLITLPPEERAPFWDVHEGQLVLRCHYTRERIVEARAQYAELKRQGYQLIMQGDQPVIRFLAVPKDAKAAMKGLVTMRDLTVIRNGMAVEHKLPYLDLAGKTYLYVEGKRKLAVGDQKRWFDGVLVRVPADPIWHMIIREAPLRKVSDLESCSQCPFWATFETETGREQRCAKGLVNNSIEALRSLYCDELVKAQDRGNQFRPFPTWVEATPEWKVDAQREGKIPTWLFHEGGKKRVSHAAAAPKKRVAGLGYWAEQNLDEECQVLAADPTVATWAESLMSAQDRLTLRGLGKTPQEWVAWLAQHGDELAVPFLSPALYARVVDLAGVDSLKALGPALGSVAMEMTDTEILEVLESTLEREVTLYQDPANEEPEEDLAA